MSISIFEDKINNIFDFKVMQYSDGGAYEVGLWHGEFPIPAIFWTRSNVVGPLEEAVLWCDEIDVVKVLKKQATVWGENQNLKFWSAGK